MAETNNREVKTDVEVLDVEDTEETTEEGEETVIPPVEDAPEEETPKEDIPAEDNTPTTESPEPSPEDGDDKTPPSTFTKKEPAPVEGETPREKALRVKVTELRTKLRHENIQEITGKGPAPENTDHLQELRDLGYSDDEIKNMEKAIDVIASKKGYVKAEQTYQGTVDTVVETFIDTNPEYKPENDPEDVRWETFKGILKSGVYNLTGKTQKQLNEIFKKVHRDVVDQLGEATVVDTTKQRAAQNQKIKSVSHSGGTKTPVVKKTSSIDPAVRGMFKGFDDEDLE